MSIVQAHIRVLGQVQGVGYRYACQQAAKKYNILGWVKNYRDGSLEITTQGLADDVAHFIDWAHQGPVYAKVDQLITDYTEDLSSFERFSIF